MNALQQLQQMRNATTRPEYVEKEVTCGGFTGKFTFRRLPYAEVDRLRLHGTNSSGQFDPQRYAGNNGRWVAATLVDPDTHALLTTEEEVNTWDTSMVDALAEAATEVNAVTKDAVKAIQGNSEDRQSAEPSAT